MPDSKRGIRWKSWKMTHCEVHCMYVEAGQVFGILRGKKPKKAVQSGPRLCPSVRALSWPAAIRRGRMRQSVKPKSLSRANEHKMTRKRGKKDFIKKRKNARRSFRIRLSLLLLSSSSSAVVELGKKRPGKMRISILTAAETLHTRPKLKLKNFLHT